MKKSFATAFFVILGIACLLNISFLQAFFRFQLLKWARKEAETAAPLADKLAKSKYGVWFALRDIDTFGGSTRGWASKVLIDTSIPGTDARLEAIKDDTTCALGKRMEAASLLERRTKRSDYLVDMFLLGKEAAAETNNTVMLYCYTCLNMCMRNDRVFADSVDEALQMFQMSVDDFQAILAQNGLKDESGSEPEKTGSQREAP